MANYARLPDGSLFPAAEGETYEQTIQAAYAKYPERFGGVAEQPQAAPKSGFVPALRAGVENLKGDVAALAGRSGIMDLAAAEKYRADRQAAAQRVFKPTEEGWTEAPFTKLGELAGGSVPYMAAPVAAAMGAAALPLTGTAATIAGVGAAGLASGAQFTGSNLSRQVEEGKKLGETDLGAAALAAVPQAALDMVSFKLTPGLRGLIYKTTGKQLAEKEVAEIAKQGLKTVAKDYAVATGKTMGAEGLTEAAQQVFERMQAGLNLTDPEAQKEYFDNFLGGAVLGGAIAPVGRYMERGKLAAEQEDAARTKDAQTRLETARREQTEKVARLQDPAYLDDLSARAQVAGENLKALQEAAKGKADPTDPQAVAEKQAARRAQAEYVRSDEYRALQQELQAAGPVLRKHQTERAAQAEAEAVKQAEAAAAEKERQRVANLSPEQYALEQVQQEGSQWGATQTGGRKKGALGAVTKDELEDLRAQREQAAQAPILEKQKELQSYAAAQFEHPRSLGITDTGTLVSYLMQDPAKARAIVETATPMPDLSPKQNREVTAALQSALSLMDKQQQKADKAETAAEYAQRTQDIQGQLPQKETRQDQKTAQTMESWQQSMEDDEKVRREGEHNLDYIEGILDRNLQGDKRVVQAAPVQITRDADAKQKQVDDLYEQMEQAVADAAAAKRANEPSVVRAAEARRQAAAEALNKLTGSDDYTGAVVRQRFSQQEALDEMQNNAERIRQGQYLGYSFNRKSVDNSGMVADLDAQIKELQAAKDALPSDKTKTKGDLERLNAEITRLSVQRNEAASKTTEPNQADLASTTQPLLWKKAEAARDSYVKSVLEEAATHRAARGLKGLTQDEALAAASEMHDLLDLRIDRTDGERNKFVKQRLKEIQQGLNNPTRQRTKVAAEPLTPQYAATEAKKTAEAKGETATTLAGELRRRSEYVQDLIEKALGREMPDNVREALQAAQRALEDGRVTRDLLNAAETQAERVLTGRLKGTKTTYSQDPTKRGRGVAQTDLEEDPRYVDDIRDALSAIPTSEYANEPEAQEGVRVSTKRTQRAEQIAAKKAELASAEKDGNTEAVKRLRQEVAGLEERDKEERDALAEQQGQGDLFAPVDNKAAIAKREKENTQYEAEVKEQQALIARLEKAAVNDRTDIRAASERIVSIRQDIERTQQKVEANRLEIKRLEQEERDKRAVAGQIDRIGTPEQTPQTFETEGGFTPDDQSVFGAKPALSTAVLGYIRATAANFAKSPMVVKARAMAAALRGQSEEAINNANLYRQIEDVRAKAVQDLRKKLDEVNNLFLDNEWVKYAYPQLYANMRAFDKSMGAFYAADEYAQVRSERKLEAMAKRHDALKAAIDKVNADIRATLSNVAKNDPRVIAAKRNAATIERLELAIDEQQAAYQNALEAARVGFTERVRVMRDEMYGPVISRLEGAISGLTVQLEKAKGQLESRLMQSDLLLQEAQQKGMTFYQLLNREFDKEMSGAQQELKSAQTQLEELYKRRDDALDAAEVNAAAAVDQLAKFELGNLEKLQKKLSKLTGTGPAAQPAVDQQAAFAEQMRQATNDAKDAIYKAKNEALQRSATLRAEAAVAPLQRTLAELEARAKKITDKRGFAAKSPVERASLLAEVNGQIAEVQAQIDKIEGKPRAADAYAKQEGNKSAVARRIRLEQMIADPKSSARRVARAQQALDVLNQRTRKLGEVSSPVQRDISKVAGAKKYVHQERKPGITQTSATANEVAAALRGNKKLTKKQAASLERKQQDDMLKIAAKMVEEKRTKLSAAKEKQAAYSKLHPDLQKPEVTKKISDEVEGLQIELALAQKNAALLGEATETAVVSTTDTQAGTPAGELEFSRGAANNVHTADSLVKELQKGIGKDVRNRVGVYDTVEALLAANPQYKGRIPADTKGFVDGKHAFLVAGNIEKGAGLSVLLHEVGVHIGMKQLFNPALYKSLVAAVNSWAKKNDGSLEARIMQAAQQRVDEANTPAHQRNDELLAHAIEEALNAGVTPTALSGKGAIGQWMARVLQAIQKVLMRFGLNVRNLTPQQIVDMAYGAAGKELSNTGKRYGGAKMFAYAGEKSATADHPSLAKAQNMLRAQAHPADVFEQTGWFIGGDGKWRYEIDDSDAKLRLPASAKAIQKVSAFDRQAELNGAYVSTKLGDIFDHPSLYAAYPKLRDKKVVLYNSSGSDLGYADKDGIGVNTNRGEADALNTIVHEVQHLLQKEEGFAPGSSAEKMMMRLMEPALNEKLVRYFDRTNQPRLKALAERHLGVIKPLYAAQVAAEKAYQEASDAADAAHAESKRLGKEWDAEKKRIQEAIDSAKNAEETAAAYDKYFAASDAYRERSKALRVMELYDALDPLLDAKVQTRRDAYKASDTFFDSLKASGDPYEQFARLLMSGYLYENTAGEVEARDAAERVGLTAEERRKTRPYSSQEITREELVFSRGRSAFENRILETRSKPRQLWDAKSKLGLAARQATADMRASLREALDTGDQFTGTQAHVSLLSADSFIGNAQAVAEMGAMHMVKDAKGFVMMQAGNSKSLADVLQAVSKVPLKNADDRLAKFQAYVTALRGEQVGYDKLEIKDAAAAEAEGKALLADIQADPEMRNALEAAHEVYRDLNRGLIEFLKETHALPRDVADRLLADKNYIPFYRESGEALQMVMPDGHPQSIGDIRSLPWLQALKGGDEKLMSFPDAALKNIAVLTNLGVQNMANRHIAYHLSALGKTAPTPTMQVRRKVGRAGEHVLRWNQEPDPAIPNDTGERHIVIDTAGTVAEGIPTDLLTQAVAGSYATFPWLLEAAGAASNLLRAGVTRNPAYVIRQLLRDPISASIAGNLKAGPMKAIAQTIRNFGSIFAGNDLDEAALRKAGVLHSNVFSGGKNDLNKVALQIAGDQQGFISRGLAFADKMAMSADAATRTQAYKDAISSGASEAEAVLAARELMNFTRHGSSASVQFLARAIPFFNAAIQGLDVTLRSAQGKMPASKLFAAKQKFFNRAMALAGMAVMYSVMMDDDEEWRKMSLRDKISYIHVPRMFGEYESLRLPAPFEVGMLFYSMPMAFMEALKGEFTPKDWDTVKDVFMAQVPGGGSLMPQAAKGIFDVTRNYNSYSGLPIVPKSMEGKDPVYQFTSRTTEFAKRMAEMLNAAGMKLSPIQLEYLSNSYLGGLPVAVAQMTNQVFAPLEQVNMERPTGRMSDMPVFGGFFQNKRGTEDIEYMYEFADKAKMAASTFDDLKSKGKAAEAREYLLEHRPEIAMSKFASEFTKVMGNFKKMEDMIRDNPRMSGDEKQKRIEAIQAQRQAIAENFRAVVKRAPAPVQ